MGSRTQVEALSNSFVRRPLEEARCASAGIGIVAWVLVWSHAYPAYGATEPSLREVVKQTTTACTIAQPSLRAICSTITAATEQNDYALFAPPAEVAGTTFTVVSNLIATNRSNSEPSVAVRTAALFNALGSLDSVSNQYCTELRDEVKAQLGENLAKVACLRPACLANPLNVGIKTECQDLDTRLRDPAFRATARAAVHAFATRRGPAIFGADKCTPPPSPNGITCVGSATAEAVIAIDELSTFAADSISAGLIQHEQCNTAPACQRALHDTLDELATIWAVGTVVTEGARRYPEFVPRLGGRFDALKNAWDAVELQFPSIDTPASKKAAVTEKSRFPLFLPFAKALIAAREPLKSVLAEMNELASADLANLGVKMRALASAVSALPNTPNPELARRIAALRTAVAQWSASPIFNSRTAVGNSTDLQPYATAAAATERELAAVQQLLSAGSFPVERACGSGHSRTDLPSGIADLCVANPPTVGLTGIRLNFAACAEASHIDCQGRAQISMLVRTGDTAVAYPLGITDVHIALSGGKVELFPLPPQPAYLPDSAVTRQSLQRLVPPTISIQSVGTPSVSADLRVTINSIVADVLGQRIVTCLTISQSRILFGVGDPCHFVGSATTLLDVVRIGLSQQLERYRSQFSLEGIPVPVQGARVLSGPGDTCPKAQASGEFSGYVSPTSASDLAICAGSRIPLPDGSFLPVYVFWERPLAHVPASDDPPYRLLVDQVELSTRLNAALSSNRIVRGLNVESIVTRGSALEAALTLPNGVRTRAVISLTGVTVQGNLEDLATQALQQVRIPSQTTFPLFGLTFSLDRAGRACTTLDANELCISNVRPGPDLTHAVLEDNGRLARMLQRQLQIIIPGTVSVEQVLPRLQVTVSLPGLGDFKFASDGSSNWNALACGALRNQLSAALGGKPINLGPAQVTIKDIRSLSCDRDRALALDVELVFGKQPIDAVLQVTPKINLAIDPNFARTALLGALTAAIPGLSIMPGATVRIVTGADGIPILRSDVKLELLKPLTASGGVEWRPGSAGPRLVGPMTIEWKEYFPIFSGIDLGDISGIYDPDKPNQFKISAIVAITEGATTNEVLRLTGTLAFEGLERVTMDSAFEIAGSRLAHATGSINLHEQVVEFDAAADGAAADLPFPHTQVLISGPACLAGGRLSVQLFKSFNLADASAIIALPSNVCPSAERRSALAAGLQKLNAEDCRVDDLGSVCARGAIDVVSLFSQTGVVRTPLGTFNPILSVSGKLDDIASLSVNASPQRIRVGAAVFGTLHVTVIFPSVTGIDADYLRALLENLLKPSIDLEALLRGDITISATHGTGSSDEATGASGSGSSSNSATQGGAVDQPQVPSQSPPGGASGPPPAPPASAPPAPAEFRLANPSGTDKIVANEQGMLVVKSSSGALTPYQVPIAIGDGDLLFARIWVATSLASELQGASPRGLSLLAGGAAFVVGAKTYILTSDAQHSLFARRVSTSDKLVEAEEIPLPQAVSKLLQGNDGIEHRILPLIAQRGVQDAGVFAQSISAVCAPPRCLAGIVKFGSATALYVPSATGAAHPLASDSLWGVAARTLGEATLKKLMEHTSGPGALRAAFVDGEMRALTVSPSDGSKAILSRVVGPNELVDTEIHTIALPDMGMTVWSSISPSPLGLLIGHLDSTKDLSQLTLAGNLPAGRAIAWDPLSDPNGLVVASATLGTVCKPTQKTVRELQQTLSEWSSPSSFSNPNSGRVRGTASDALAALTSAFLSRNPGSPFLIDPVFIFYPGGKCP